jgi:hypothetical protein
LAVRAGAIVYVRKDGTGRNYPTPLDCIG